MKSYLLDHSKEREHAVRVCEIKLCEAVGLIAIGVMFN